MNLKRPIDGPLKSNITIVRTVSGLSLPIRCYIVNGQLTGSCVYNDLCASIMYVLDLDQTDCPNNFIQNGIDCTCPFNLPSGILEIEEQLPTYSPAFLTNSWLLKGDYNLRVEASDKRGFFFCVTLGFTLA